jgi:PBP1b-binding outer membrane lipoprotein LpoB
MNHTPFKHWMTRSYRLFAGLSVALLLTACVSAPLAPTEELTAAQDAITEAEQAEARQFAQSELEDARARLLRAEEAVVAEEMSKAEYLAIQARVTAELALARTEATKATEINREMQRSADALDEEMQRQGDQ